MALAGEHVPTYTWADATESPVSCWAHGCASTFLDQHKRLEMIIPLQARAKKFNLTLLLLLSPHSRDWQAITRDTWSFLMSLETCQILRMCLYSELLCSNKNKKKQRRTKIVTSIDNWSSRPIMTIEVIENNDNVSNWLQFPVAPIILVSQLFLPQACITVLLQACITVLLQACITVQTHRPKPATRATVTKHRILGVWRCYSLAESLRWESVKGWDSVNNAFIYASHYTQKGLKQSITL